MLEEGHVGLYLVVCEGLLLRSYAPQELILQEFAPKTFERLYSKSPTFACRSQQ